jgi:hypothetical protein
VLRDRRRARLRARLLRPLNGRSAASAAVSARG